MPKPNFQFEKRKKELERKKKSEEKQQRKLAKNSPTHKEDSLTNSDQSAQPCTDTL